MQHISEVRPVCSVFRLGLQQCRQVSADRSGVTDHCKVVAYLQEKSGSTWKTVSTWTDESDGLRASVSKSKSVTAGKTYRAKAVVTAWSGSDSESATIYSSEETA